MHVTRRLLLEREGTKDCRANDINTVECVVSHYRYSWDHCGSHALNTYLYHDQSTLGSPRLLHNLKSDVINDLLIIHSLLPPQLKLAAAAPEVWYVQQLVTWLGASVVMSGTYAALDTAEPRRGHVQELGVCHTGELSSSNEEYVFIEVRSSSHLKPVVKRSDPFCMPECRFATKPAI